MDDHHRGYCGGLPVELGRYGAALEKLIGDAVMAVFGTPVPRSKGRGAA